MRDKTYRLLPRGIRFTREEADWLQTQIELRVVLPRNIKRGKNAEADKMSRRIVSAWDGEAAKKVTKALKETRDRLVDEMNAALDRHSKIGKAFRALPPSTKHAAKSAIKFARVGLTFSK